MTEASPPNMNDMFLVGLPLSLAAALERDIAENPTMPVANWWKILRAWKPPLPSPA